MHEIKCPVCGAAFSVDEAGYAQILQQVRNEEFERELKRREDELLKKGESDIKLSVMERQSQFDKELSKKDSELAEGLISTTIARDGIAVIVNLESTVESLTAEQIKSIYLGEITSWDEIN